MKDPFKILGLSESSTTREVKEKWRKLAMEHHPDRGGNPCDFNEFRSAYYEALKLAKDFEDCKWCRGTGLVINARGFNSISVPCDQCSGGKIPKENSI